MNNQTEFCATGQVKREMEKGTSSKVTGDITWTWFEIKSEVNWIKLSRPVQL